MDWFPWYPALYRADTLDLTLEQDGAYRRLIDHYMETRLPLPDNDNALSRIIGISVNDFQAIAEQLRSKFTAKAGFLHSKRCDIELNRQDSLSKKRSNVAKSAYEKRNNNNTQEAIAEQKPSNCTNTGQDKTGEDSKEVSNHHASPEGEADETLKAKGKSNGKSRGSRIPDDWQPSEKGRSFAIERGLIGDALEDAIAEHKDYWGSAAGQRATKTDWEKVWYNRVRQITARRRAGGSVTSTRGPMDQGTVAAARRLIDRHRRNTGP